MFMIRIKRIIRRLYVCFCQETALTIILTFTPSLSWRRAKLCLDINTLTDINNTNYEYFCCTFLCRMLGSGPLTVDSTRLFVFLDTCSMCLPSPDSFLCFYQTERYTTFVAPRTKNNVATTTNNTAFVRINTCVRVHTRARYEYKTAVLLYLCMAHAKKKKMAHHTAHTYR